MHTHVRTLVVAIAAVALTLGGVGAATATPPANAGLHLSAKANNARCTVTFTMLNYTNAHNWFTMDYWFAQEDQPWAPPDAEMHSSGWDPNNLPTPWRIVSGAKRPVARYTPASPSDSTGSLRGALPASFPQADRYGYNGIYTNFNPTALTKPFKTTVTFDPRKVTPAPPAAVNGRYTIRYRVYLGPQTQAYGYWTPRSITVGGCRSSNGSLDWGSIHL